MVDNLTARATAFWGGRAKEEGGLLQDYWESWLAPHRVAVAAALRAFPSPPFQSILDLGCYSGPLLRHLRQEFPQARLAGIDVSGPAIAFAQRHLAGTFVTGSILDLDAWPPGPFDVIVSSYALAYLGPTDLPLVLRACLARTRRGLVFAEPQRLGTEFSPPVADEGLGETIHDYRLEFSSLGVPGELMALRRLTPPVERLNGVLTVRWTDSR